MSSTCHPLRRALTTNSTAVSFQTLIPTVTEPSGAGIFDLFSAANGDGFEPFVPRYLDVIPFGTDGNNDLHNMRVWGWSQVGVSALYIPVLLAEVAFTLGNISGAAIGTNHFMADTITLTYGDSNAPIITNAADLPAHFLIHMRGSRYIQFDFKIDTGGVAANCYWRTMDQGR
jgi:hypothetical protein